MDSTQYADVATAIAAVLTFLVVGMAFGWRRDRRETRKARSDADLAKLEAERVRIEVERSQREAEQEARAKREFEEEREARPSAEWLSGPTPSPGGHTYTFRIWNRGKVFGDNVTVWIVDADDNDVSEHQVLDQMLDPGDAREITLPVLDGGRPPLKLRSSWRDTSGMHQRESWVRVPAPGEPPPPGSAG